MFGPPLEGFHRGATCVVTPVTGHEEYVEHGWNGLLTDWEDLRGTARQLDLLARDRELLHFLRSNALETARAWPSWEQSSQFMAACAAGDRPRATTPERGGERSPAGRPAGRHRDLQRPSARARGLRAPRAALRARRGAGAADAPGAGTAGPAALPLVQMRARPLRPLTAARAGCCREAGRTGRTLRSAASDGRGGPPPRVPALPSALLELAALGPAPLTPERPDPRRAAEHRHRDPIVPARERWPRDDRPPAARAARARALGLAVAGGLRGPPCERAGGDDEAELRGVLRRRRSGAAHRLRRLAGSRRRARHRLADSGTGAAASRRRQREPTWCRTTSPDFYGASAESLWALQTYRQGLHCIAASPWLAELLRTRYGAERHALRPRCRPRGLPSDGRTASGGPRCFYARAVTPRRAVPLGLLALAELSRAAPRLRDRPLRRRPPAGRALRARQPRRARRPAAGRAVLAGDGRHGALADQSLARSGWR